MKYIINQFLFFIITILIIITFNNCKKKINTTNNYKGFKKAPALIADKVWLIDDNGADNSYLVIGKKKAMLIDTGTGIYDLASLVKTLTKLPVIVVNTHGHPDHSSGNYSFKKVYAHPSDFNAIQRFSNNEHNIELISVKDGNYIDLGDRIIEIIETPGHTGGSICLLDKKNKILFTGDSSNLIVWLFLNESMPVETYLNSLQKLNSCNKEFIKIMPGHGTPLDSSFLEEMIECTKNVLNGSQGKPYHTFVGDTFIYSYKRASVAFNPNNLRKK